MSRIAISMLTVLAGAATPAFAQPEDQQPARVLKGDPRKPLGEGRGEGRAQDAAAAGRASFTFVQSDGQDTIKVKVVDGEVSAEVNGKAVPADRIRQSGGKIEILNEKGDVEHTVNANIGGMGLNFGAAPAQPRTPRVKRDVLRAAPGDGGIAIARVEAPKVMLGITMSTADDTTLKRLGVDKQAGVFIDTVIEGLPAEKAGVEANDLIVEADGKTDLSEVKLREILKAKNPGDTLKVKVLRKGENKDLSIKLEAYSGDKLAQAMPEMLKLEEIPQGFRFGGQPMQGFAMGGDEKLRELLEEALSELKGDAKDWEKIKTQVVEQLEEALGQLEHHQFQFNIEGMDQLKEMFGGQPFVRVDKDRAFVAPLPDAPQPPAGHAQLDRIAEQLERLNRRLDDLERKIDKK